MALYTSGAEDAPLMASALSTDTTMDTKMDTGVVQMGYRLALFRYTVEIKKASQCGVGVLFWYTPRYSRPVMYISFPIVGEGLGGGLPAYSNSTL